MKKKFRAPYLGIEMFRAENIVLTSGITPVPSNIDKASEALANENIQISLQTLIEL